jgi:hypothetical protein
MRCRHGMRENTSVFYGANNVFRTVPKVQSLIFEMDKNRTTISSISMVRPRPVNRDGRGVLMIILIVLEFASFQTSEKSLYASMSGNSNILRMAATSSSG